jgi:hypothetical protein
VLACRFVLCGLFRKNRCRDILAHIAYRCGALANASAF